MSVRRYFSGLPAVIRFDLAIRFQMLAEILNRDQPFMLSAINSSEASSVFQNASELSRHASDCPIVNSEHPG